MADGIQKKYALIINGDTEDRHPENVDRAILALRSEAHYEISVASVQKPSESVEDFAHADEAGLKKLIKGLGSKLDDDDLLVIYTTGHGRKPDDKKEACLEFKNTCFSFADLREKLDKLSYGKRMVVMDQCFSGNVIKLFANDKTAVVATGSPYETGPCNKLSPHFWSNQVTDRNQDGIITLQERYAYAVYTGDPATETQFYSPFAPIAFSGKSEEVGRFPDQSLTVLTVKTEKELKKELKKLEPGDLALVMFSPDFHCPGCDNYLPKFNELAKKFKGRFLMIHAEPPKGSGENWSEYGIVTYPTVAFIDHRGRTTLVDDRVNPLASLSKTVLIKEEEVLGYYLEKLKTPDVKQKNLALKALGNMGEKALPVLPQLLSALEDPQTRAEASGALFRIGKKAPDKIPVIVPALVKWLDGGPNAVDRGSRSQDDLEAEETIEEVFRLWGEPTVPKLIEMLDSENLLTREQALSALSPMGLKAESAIPKLKELIESQDSHQIRHGALIALARMGDKAFFAFPKMIEMLNASETRAGAERCIYLISDRLSAKNKKKAVKMMRKLLKSESDTLQMLAGRLLMYFGKSAVVAIPDLLRNLSSPVKEVRYETAFTLGVLAQDADKRTSGNIFSRLKKMAVEDGAARKGAILGLEQWKQVAIPALMELARSDQQELQILSIASLAEIGRNTTGKKQIEIADFLLSFFPHFRTETPNKALLEAVLYALEKMREQGPKIIPQLVTLLDGHSPVAKSMAAFSLWNWQRFSPESISTSEMKEKLVRELSREENPDFSRGYVYILFLLAEKDPSILPAIRPLLQHPSSVVRAGSEEILKRR